MQLSVNVNCEHEQVHIIYLLRHFCGDVVGILTSDIPVQINKYILPLR